MNTAATKKSWLFLENTAAVMLIIGVVLNLSGFDSVGSRLIAAGVPLVVAAALKLGHLKWY